jgi:glycosyltransferase involved in cell wall biosynthesis
MSRSDVSLPAVLIETKLASPAFGMQDNRAQVARSPRLSVVMPVYNEMATIKEILARVQAVDIDKEIILVDDGSTDGTREFLAELATGIELHPSAVTEDSDGRLQRSDPIRIFFQKKNYGKGAALRRGFQKARGEIVIIQDADLELDPQEYPKLIEPIELGLADVVYGSRFLGKPRQDVSFAHYLGNKFLTASSNALTGMKLTDVWTGYKVFRREVLQTIDIRENRFGFEPEITAKVAKQGCRLQEVPVSYSCRAREDGKKISWKDGFRGMWCTFRYSLFR